MAGFLDGIEIIDANLKKKWNVFKKKSWFFMGFFDKNYRCKSYTFIRPNQEQLQRIQLYVLWQVSKGVNLSQKVGGGDGLQTMKVQRYATRNFFWILVHWEGIPSVLEALIKLYYNVHDQIDDLKSMWEC